MLPHICYVTPAGYICSCGTSATTPNGHQAMVVANKHALPFARGKNTTIIDLRSAAQKLR